MSKWNIGEGWVDSHVHLADLRLAADLGQVLARAREAGIDNFALGGVDPLDWGRASELSQRERGIFPSFGLHPYFVATSSVRECEAAFILLKSRLSSAFGLGECGLDFRDQHLGREKAEAKAKQRLFFEQQLELAESELKVAIVHVVRAHAEALENLKILRSRGYLLHSFHAEKSMARRHLDLGARLSISGSLLRQGAHRLEESVRFAPLSRLLLESDAPDQHPNHTSARLNEPTTILLVAQRIAELKNITPEEVLKITRENFFDLFCAEFKEEVAPS